MKIMTCLAVCACKNKNVPGPFMRASYRSIIKSSNRIAIASPKQPSVRVGFVVAKIKFFNETPSRTIWHQIWRNVKYYDMLGGWYSSTRLRTLPRNNRYLIFQACHKCIFLLEESNYFLNELCAPFLFD